MDDAGEEPFGGNGSGHWQNDVQDNGPDSGEEAHEETVAHGAAKMRGIGPACPKEDKGDGPEQLRGEHPADPRVHFRIGSPELLGASVIGRHPDTVNKKVGDKENDECNDDSEKKALDIHDRG